MISKRELLLGGLALAVPEVAHAQGVIRVPLKRTEDGDLTVQMTINNQGPFTFLVDIGSGITSIRQSLSNSLNLQFIGDSLEPYVVEVGVQLYPAYRMNAVDVVFGTDFARRNVVFMRVPDAALASSGYDGVVGRALFLAEPDIIDFEAPEIRLYADGAMPLDGFQPVQALVRRSGVNSSAIAMQCQFAGQTEMLSVGTIRNGIYLTSAYVREHKLWDQFSEYREHTSKQDNSPNHSWDKYQGLLGAEPNLEKAPIRIVKLKDFAVGSFKMGEIDLWLSNPDIEDRVDEKVGFVGGDVISKFDIALGTKNQVWLKPNASFEGAGA